MIGYNRTRFKLKTLKELKKKKHYTNERFVFDMNEVVIKVQSGECSTHGRNGSLARASVRACRIVMRVIGACYRTEPVTQSERSKRSLKPP